MVRRKRRIGGDKREDCKEREKKELKVCQEREREREGERE